MRSFAIPCDVFVSEVKNHSTIKQDILNAIRDMGEFSYRMKENQLSNTDWHLTTVERKYYDIVKPILDAHNEELGNALGFNMNITNYWFQQYKTGDSHTWHLHGGATHSNVYYVELDSENPKTSFRHNGNEFDVPVKEGCILTFPSYLTHCSKENKSLSTKTVIGFNTDAWIKHK